MITAPTFVYRLFDASDRLLYVGVSSNLGTRFKAHAKDKNWWPDVVRFSLVQHADRVEALAAELAAIRSERPLHNIVGAVAEMTPELITLINARQKWDRWEEQMKATRTDVEAHIVAALKAGAKVSVVDALSPFTPRHTSGIARRHGIEPRKRRARDRAASPSAS